MPKRMAFLPIYNYYNKKKRELILAKKPELRISERDREREILEGERIKYTAREKKGHRFVAYIRV